MKRTMMKRFAAALMLAILAALFAANAASASALGQDQDKAGCAGEGFSGRATGESPIAGIDYPGFVGDFASGNARSNPSDPGFDSVAQPAAQVQPCSGLMN